MNRLQHLIRLWGCQRNAEAVRRWLWDRGCQVSKRTWARCLESDGQPPQCIQDALADPDVLSPPVSRDYWESADYWKLGGVPLPQVSLADQLSVASPHLARGRKAALRQAIAGISREVNRG